MPDGVVALLPVKAHSARVPEKNFRDFHGKPLTRWILETLLGIAGVERIIINTDARKKLEDVGVSDSDRVQIRDRKPLLCGDEVSMNLILADDVASSDSELFLMTHTTNPLLRRDTIERAMAEFFTKCAASTADSLFTVNRYQTRFYRADASPINHDPDNLIPTQDLEPWFEENSNLYIFTRTSFLKTNARIGRKPMMFQTPRIESFDLDTEDDWQVAESLAKALYPHGD